MTSHIHHCVMAFIFHFNPFSLSFLGSVWQFLLEIHDMAMLIWCHDFLELKILLHRNQKICKVWKLHLNKIVLLPPKLWFKLAEETGWLFLTLVFVSKQQRKFLLLGEKFVCSSSWGVTSGKPSKKERSQIKFATHNLLSGSHTERTTLCLHQTRRSHDGNVNE